MKDESKLWQKIKKNTPNIIWTRVESWASFGFPDLVGYTEKGGFFTVELKVIKSKKISFSPHQIAFHIKHPRTPGSCLRPSMPGPLNFLNIISSQAPRSDSLRPAACALVGPPAHWISLSACCLRLEPLSACASRSSLSAPP